MTFLLNRYVAFRSILRKVELGVWFSSFHGSFVVLSSSELGSVEGAQLLGLLRALDFNPCLVTFAVQTNTKAERKKEKKSGAKW